MTAKHETDHRICGICKHISYTGVTSILWTCKNPKSDHFQHIFLVDHPACGVFEIVRRPDE